MDTHTWKGPAKKKVKIFNIYGSSKNMANAFITLLVEGIEMKKTLCVTHKSNEYNRRRFRRSVQTWLLHSFSLTRHRSMASPLYNLYTMCILFYIYMNMNECMLCVYCTYVCMYKIAHTRNEMTRNSAAHTRKKEKKTDDFDVDDNDEQDRKTLRERKQESSKKKIIIYKYI